MKKGFVDKDLGMEDILKNIEALGHMAVKAGITQKEGEKEVDGVTVYEYATYNEYGVPGPPYSENGDGKWFIPPRPFVTGWVENRYEEIKGKKELLFKLVSSGKTDAEEAVHLLGREAVTGIQKYIMTGSFTPNAESTKKRKRGSSRPLIDKTTMKRAVSYEVVKGD